MTDKEAAEALRAADQGLRAGASTVGPRHRVQYLLVTGLLAVAFGACFDIPASLWGVGAILRFPLPMVIVFGWTLYTRRAWSARPRVSGYGARIVALLVALHLACFAAATLVGFGLHGAGVPVPFTLAGLAYGLLITVVLSVAARGLAVRYAEGIARKHR